MLLMSGIIAARLPSIFADMSDTLFFAEDATRVADGLLRLLSAADGLLLARILLAY